LGFTHLSAMIIIYFFNDTPTTVIYTLSLHDALPIYTRFLLEEILPAVEREHRLRQDAASRAICGLSSGGICAFTVAWHRPDVFQDRKSTRLNSSHVAITYAVFCLKK